MSEERLDRIERLIETALSDVFQSLKLLNERQSNLQTQQANSQTQIDELRDTTQNQIDALF